MPTELLISSDPWENRVAVLEDGHLAEIYFEREEKVIGSIYKGRVMNVLPGMGASFVDIGLGRNAFLYVDDINKTPLNIGDVEITQGRTGWTISDKVERGDEVLVQIVKEPRGLKGARISTNISLPGRYLILMPTGKYSGVSRKIESAEERNRLKAIMKSIRPPEMATVVRTAAAGVSQSELIADLGVLIRMWHGILESYKRAPAPSLIHKDMNLVYKAARDFITPEVDRVLIDDAEEFEKVRDFMRLLGPQYVDRIQHYNGGRSLFADFKIDEEVQKLLRPKVNLPSGGSIVIESTEALTVIDVNSGKFTGGRNLEDTIVKTNVEAAAEIARQVRLRDIGGIIVCDFIDMSSEGSRNKVIATLEAGLRKDRTRTTIQSFSALGLLEFTRKRVGKDLAGQLRAACPTCSGLGSVMSPETVAIDAFRGVRRLGHQHHNGNGTHRPIEVISAPTVGAQIDYWYEDELEQLEREIETKVAVRVDPALHPERTKIVLLDDAAAALAPPKDVRVGDELEVELLSTKLPTATSAAAVVGNRLVEVENAAGALGQTIKIKVIDIDEDGNVLAEPRASLAQAHPEAKKRRRRGGRGRKKELTPAEQEEQLRELAEEAARGVGGRPALGISTSAEAEAEDAVERAHPPSSPPIATVTPLRPVPDYAATTPGEERVYASYGGPDEARRRRRRRRRRRGERAEGAPAAALTGVANDVEAAPEQAPAAKLEAIDGGAAAAGNGTEAAAGEDGVRRRRRRRRRRGRGGAGTDVAAGTGLEAVPDRAIFRVGADGAAERTGETAPPEPSRAIAPVEQRRRGAVALEPPPPSLSAPEEPLKVAKPARGRRTRTTATAELEARRQPALPGTLAEPAPAGDGAPKRGGRRTAAAVAAEPSPDGVPAPSARTRRRTAAATAEPAAEAAPKPKRTTRAPAAAVAEAPKPRATRTAASTVAEAPKPKVTRAAAATAAEAPKPRATRAKAATEKATAAEKPARTRTTRTKAGAEAEAAPARRTGAKAADDAAPPKPRATAAKKTPARKATTTRKKTSAK